MGRKVLNGMGLCLILTIFLLGGVFYRYWNEDKTEGQETEKKRELVILSTYEAEPLRDGLYGLAECYMDENPQVEVRCRFVSSADFQKEICMEKDKDQLADLIICDSVMTPALVSMGIFQEPVCMEEPEKVQEYSEAAYAATLVNGKCYAVPFACDPYVLFYNKKYFSQNGLGAPRDMEELYAELHEVRTFGKYNFAMACKDDEELTAAFLQMVYADGGNILELDGEESLRFYERMQDFRDHNIFPLDMVNWNQEDLMHSFSEGLVVSAMGKLSSKTLLEEMGMRTQYGMVEISFGQDSLCLFQGENIGLTVEAGDTEAEKLLSYLTGEEAAVIFARKTGKLSARLDVSYNPAKENGLGEDFLERQKYQSIAGSSYSSWFLISQAVSDEMIFFFTTQTDAQSMAQNMQTSVREAIMKR